MRFVPPSCRRWQIFATLDFANQRVQLRNFVARVGSSDLAGSIEVDPKVEPPEMTAELTSRRVDLADLGGFVGTTPGRTTTPGQTASQRAEVARAEAQPRLIPDTPIDVPKLRWANVHLHYRGQSIEGRSVPLDNLDVRLDIKDGQVTLHPLSFGVGKGRIATSIELTPQDNATHARADIEFQRVDVSRLNLTGQENVASLNSLLKRLGKRDVIIDMTASPNVFNLLTAVAIADKKPLVWAEVFGGGVGGLVARSRPGKDPDPQMMRAALTQYTASQPAPEFATSIGIVAAAAAVSAKAPA